MFLYSYNIEANDSETSHIQATNGHVRSYVKDKVDNQLEQDLPGQLNRLH